jgi:hypothetical protein
MSRRLAAVFLVALGLAPAAHAAGGPVFGLRAVGNPKLGYFVYPLQPGHAAHGAVIVSNTGTKAGTVRLSSADATTGSTSGTVYLTNRRPRLAGAWISLQSSRLFLRPGRHARVEFDVRVPRSVQPGQWVGGIVAESSHRVQGPSSKRKARVQINIRDLTIVAVQVNVAGAQRTAMKVGAVKTGGQRGFQQLITHLANDGSVLVKPRGTVTVFSKDGSRLQSLPFTMDTFLPRTAIDYPVLLKHALAPGTYSVLVSLNVPPNAGAKGATVSARRTLVVSPQDVKQVFTSATPQTPPTGGLATSSSPSPTGSSSSPSWWLVAAIVGAALLLVILFVLLLGRRRPPSAAPAAPVEPAPAIDRNGASAVSVAPRVGTPADWTAPPPPRAQEPEPRAAPDTIVDAAPVVERAPEPPAAPRPEPEVEPAPAVEPEPLRAAATPSLRRCDHLWEVAYHRGILGNDGVWRFPHHCRDCGRELLATDVTDASRQAAVRATALKG